MRLRPLTWIRVCTFTGIDFALVSRAQISPLKAGELFQGLQIVNGHDAFVQGEQLILAQLPR